MSDSQTTLAPVAPKPGRRPPPPPKGNKRALGARGNTQPRGRMADPVFIQRIALAFRAGMTDVEVANLVNIGLRTIKLYKAKNQELIAPWKDAADEIVERSLFKRATGYVAPDVHVSNYQGNVTVTPIEKHIAPDTAAATFWLKNRKPKEWGEREQTEAKLVNINISFGDPVSVPVSPKPIEVESQRVELGSPSDTLSVETPSEHPGQGQEANKISW